MYTKLSIPERLKDLRVVDKHLTLEQLAEQTGLSKSALGKYEADDYKDISPFAIATLMDMLQLEEAEYNLIKFPQRGVCLYKCGNERYLLEVHAPAYKEKLFGTAGGR